MRRVFGLDVLRCRAISRGARRALESVRTQCAGAAPLAAGVPPTGSGSPCPGRGRRAARVGLRGV